MIKKTPLLTVALAMVIFEASPSYGQSLVGRTPEGGITAQRDQADRERLEREKQNQIEQESARESASKIEKENNKAGMIGMVTGGALIALGKYMVNTAGPTNGAQRAMGYYQMMQGGLSLLQGGENYKTGAGAGIAGGAFDGDYGDYGTGVSDVYGYPEEVQGLKPYKVGIKGLNDLKKAGYIVNKDGSIKFPDGSTLPVGSSAAGLGAKLGLSKESLKKMKKQTKEVIAQSLVKVNKAGFESGVGRNSSTASSDEEYDIDGELDALLGRHKKKNLTKSRKLATVSGMYRMHKGLKIGVAGDNIFKMMTRRYDLKKRQRVFIK